MPADPVLSADRAQPPVPRLDARTLVNLCGMFFLSRLLVLSVAALSHQVVAQGPFSTPGRTWVERFAQWDSGWYLGIAGGGYTYDPAQASSVAFYPAYPLLIRAAAWLGLDASLAGYAISHAALLLSCLLLWKLAALETRSATVAERAVLFLLFCPGAMWFGMIYTESLFLLTLLGCLLCARQGRWLAAGAWGLVSALTRTPGLLLAGFLLLEAVQQWQERRRAAGPSLRLPVTPHPSPITDHLAPSASHPSPTASRLPWPARAALGAAGPVCGHLAYLIFLQIRFGDWRAQQKTMAIGWGGILQPPWTALAGQWQFNERHLMEISTPLLAITVALALAGLFTLKRVGYTALILALCVLYVSATPGESVTRYLSTAAPVYIVLAQMAARSRLLETAAFAFSVGMMTLLTVLLVNGYHVV